MCAYCDDFYSAPLNLHSPHDGEFSPATWAKLEADAKVNWQKQGGQLINTDRVCGRCYQSWLVVVTETECPQWRLHGVGG